jgi:hypothetical protein
MYSGDPYLELAGAIIRQAYDDLVNAYRKQRSGDPQAWREVKRMESWFRGPSFGFFAGNLHPDYFIRLARKEAHFGK